MDFFNSVIKSTFDSLEGLSEKILEPSTSWKDVGYSQVVLLRDTYTELDGVGYNLITTDDTEDSVVVIGDDIKALKGKVPFARISLIQFDDSEDDQKNYDRIRKIEYTKYHTFPDGYMIRTSSRSHKEIVRVSSAAIENGIDFQKVGSLFIKKYKENPFVKAVKIYFVTDSNADYASLSACAEKNNRITETLNHIMNSVNFDCNVCNLKPICDEVEGMRELHFKNKTM